MKNGKQNNSPLRKNDRGACEEDYFAMFSESTNNSLEALSINPVAVDSKDDSQVILSSEEEYVTASAFNSALNRVNARLDALEAAEPVVAPRGCSN